MEPTSSTLPLITSINETDAKALILPDSNSNAIGSLIARVDSIWRSPWLADPEISIRVLMLLYYASTGALMPYYPIFYKNLGLTGKETLVSFFT
jgi:hypothetical protein